MDRILLLIREEDDQERYCFLCPQCDELQDKPADKKLATLLIFSGATEARRGA